MRLTLAALAALTLLAQTAKSAEPLPHFRKDTHYPIVRARMIKLGFEPARVLKRAQDAFAGCGYPGTGGGPGVCERWPEILHCSDGIGRCEFAYYRKRDGARIFVITEGDNDIYNCYCFVSIRWPDKWDREYFATYLIARPVLRRQAAVPAH